MKLKVIEYDEYGNFHSCEDQDGLRYRVDLLVCGELPEETTHASLVGKTVEVEELIPYLLLARKTKIIGSTLSESNKVSEEILAADNNNQTNTNEIHKRLS